MTTYKVLGKRGRITIPLESRIKMGFEANDILAIEERDDNTLIIRKEKVCGHCNSSDVQPMAKPTNETTLLQFLSGLSTAEQRAALVHLSLSLTASNNGGLR